MKYLKTYEKEVTFTNLRNSFGIWTINKLLNKSSEDEYIERCSFNYLNMKDIDVSYICDIHFGRNVITINYRTNNIYIYCQHSYKIKSKEKIEFLNYLNNPEIYKEINNDSKKFNK